MNQADSAAPSAPLRRCEDRCDQYGCDGFFLPEIKEGINCTACPIFGCAACEDLTGKCTKCRSGLALLDGECRRCRAFECQQCDGEAWGWVCMKFPGTAAQRTKWHCTKHGMLLNGLRSCRLPALAHVRPQLSLATWRCILLLSAGGLDKCTSCYLPNAFGKEGFYADAAGNCTQANAPNWGAVLHGLQAHMRVKLSPCSKRWLQPAQLRPWVQMQGAEEHAPCC